MFQFRVDQESRAQHLLPQETVTAIFSNVKSIYKFHAEFLLPQVTKGEARRENIWKIILKKCLPSYRKYLCVEVKSRGEQIEGINTLLYFSGYGDNIKPMIYPSAHHSVSLSAHSFLSRASININSGKFDKIFAIL